MGNRSWLICYALATLPDPLLSESIFLTFQCFCAEVICSCFQISCCCLGMTCSLGNLVSVWNLLFGSYMVCGGRNICRSRFASSIR